MGQILELYPNQDYIRPKTIGFGRDFLRLRGDVKKTGRTLKRAVKRYVDDNPSLIEVEIKKSPSNQSVSWVIPCKIYVATITRSAKPILETGTRCPLVDE